MSSRQALKEELLKTDDQFRRLYEEHQAFERRLEELSQSTVLSEQDEIEEKQIKRQKLLLKDRMALLLSEAEAQVPA